MYNVADFIIWWYTRGFKLYLKYLKAYILILADTFSVRILVSTFFQPWRKDVTPSSGLSIDQKLRVLVYNLIAIFFGMFIKFFAFIAFLICFVVLILLEIILIIVWVIMPFLILELIVVGVIYLMNNNGGIF